MRCSCCPGGQLFSQTRAPPVTPADLRAFLLVQRVASQLLLDLFAEGDPHPRGDIGADKVLRRERPASVETTTTKWDNRADTVMLVKSSYNVGNSRTQSRFLKKGLKITLDLHTNDKPHPEISWNIPRILVV